MLNCSIDDVTSKRQKVEFICACGRHTVKRIQDVLDNQQIECKFCASKRRAEKILPKLLPLLQRNAASMKGVLKKPKEWTRLRLICQGAKGRCTNPNSKNYKNYGGRGIKFEFSSASEMAEWIVEHLGYPKAGESIDRIDNSKGYAPGNLRWANRKVQANNKREYKRTDAGERIRYLSQLKPEFGYERLREFIKEGLTDDEIIARKRTTAGRPRVRHS